MTSYKIMLVGEAWGEKEELAGQPFVGGAGHVLNGMLRQIGLPRSDCYITNVFNFKPAGNKIETLCGSKAEGITNFRPLLDRPQRFLLQKYLPELHRLYREIDNVQPNVIVAFGNTALWALCKKSGIKKYRGSPLMTFDLSTEVPMTSRTHFKVIPSWHPAAVMRQWSLRPISLADLTKVIREAETPKLLRPSHLIYLNPTLEDIEDFYHEHLVGQEFLSCDTETKELTITEVGYATVDGSRAIVIPFWSRKNSDGNYWPTLEQEREAWEWVRRINAEFPLIGQNFSYDMKYFWRTMGIPCPKFLGDTMILHHSMQPEMEKSLGFLGSVFTNEPSWKFMRTDHTTLKKED